MEDYDKKFYDVCRPMIYELVCLCDGSFSQSADGLSKDDYSLTV